MWSEKKSWLVAPVVFALSSLVLFTVWAVMEPAALRMVFDADGRSLVEVATLPVFALIIPTVWVFCPFTGSVRRKALLCAGVSCVAFMAVVKETDAHLGAIAAIWPDVVAGFRGTPFKMRFLTNGDIPILAKLFVIMYFVSFFGVFAAMLAYYSKKLVKGFFRFHPVAWTICFFGGSGVMVQVFDRLPAWYRHSVGMSKEQLPESFLSFCTAFEEGCEMLIAVFALLAIVQAHEIYSRKNTPSEFADL